jgi:hypothetical protein
VSAPDALCARSPRFSPDGAMLVYLTVHDLDAHNSCSSLRACALATDAHSVIVDVVDTPASPDAFPGLYLGALPSNAFVGDHTLVLSTPWRAMVRAVAVDVRTRSIEMLFADLNESVTVLDARRNALLMSTSSPTQVPRTTLARWTREEYTCARRSVISFDSEHECVDAPRRARRRRRAHASIARRHADRADCAHRRATRRVPARVHIHSAGWW